MRVLILGGDGMLGHQLLRHFSRAHDVAATLHGAASTYAHVPVLAAANCFHDVDVRRFDRLRAVVESFGPEAIVNAVGVVKQRRDAKDRIVSIEINALFPHRLADLCRSAGVKLLHISTDCVFSGQRGSYSEDDVPDPVDVYGRSKVLGEVSDAPCITLRTSMIGPELSRKSGLYEWLRSERGNRIRGFTQAIFSGLTTFELARVIERVLTCASAQGGGLYHVAGTPISKYDLVSAINARCGFGLEIVPDGSLRLDRSLDGRRFNTAFDYQPPGWDAMIDELHQEDWGRVS